MTDAEGATAAVRTPTDPWALALSGDGERRWQMLGEGAACGVARAAVVDRCAPHLTSAGGGALPVLQAHEIALETLERIDSWLARGLAVAGWLGFELGAALEHLPPASHGPLDRTADRALPAAELFAFAPEDLQPIELPAVAAGAAPGLPAGLVSQGPAFQAAVRDGLAAIAAGEIYQVNLSVAVDLPAPGAVPLLHALAALRAVQPVPFALAMEGTGYRLLSGSMERFLHVQGDVVRSRPIKGTAARGETPQQDAEQARLLCASPKERAENTMIVDMVRNDLQRACAMGSVRVPELLQAVAYKTLWHLESEVWGRLKNRSPAALLAVTLPPASVTGCPKVQAMRVIARTEARRRGPYCGTVGVWLPDGRSDASVAIRQLVQVDGRARLDVGAGIVADSQPAAEWRELCLKAASGLRLWQTLHDLAVQRGARGTP